MKLLVLLAIGMGAIAGVVWLICAIAVLAWNAALIVARELSRLPRHSRRLTRRTRWLLMVTFLGGVMWWITSVFSGEQGMSSIKDPAVLASLFIVLVNGGLIAAMVGKLALLYAIVAKFSPSWQERIMRSIAAMAGCLLYVGAKAFGLSIPTFLLAALTEGRAYITGSIGALLPAAVGFIVAWYVTGYLNSRNARRNLVGMRLLALVITVVFFLFADVYIASVDAAHNTDGLQLLLPNVSFCLAVMLYSIFEFHPQTEPDPAANDGT
jgi:hypothetical protein